MPRPRINKGQLVRLPDQSIWSIAPNPDICCICGKERPIVFIEPRRTGRGFSIQQWPFCADCVPIETTSEIEPVHHSCSLAGPRVIYPDSFDFGSIGDGRKKEVCA